MKALRYFAALVVIVTVVGPCVVSLAIWRAVQEFEKWDT